MSDLFLKILNFSINASWIIVAVLILRKLLKKAPKWVSCLLWGLVAVRLVCPFSLKSVLSLLPSSEVIPADIVTVQKPVINTGIAVINSSVNPVISESLAPDMGDSVNPLQVIVGIVTVIWAAGLIAMALYGLISYFRLRIKVRASVMTDKNVMACDDVRTPFILGFFRPVIYVPSTLTGSTLEKVIAHERAHIKRHDHWWKPLGFALLAVYWFNPLCWAAYILLCRDIEAACDEKVIHEKDKEYIAEYSQALLDLSLPGKMVAACPLAFGETNVKGRVKGVLNYKKPAFWIVLIALISCIAVGACFLTDPVTMAADDELIEFLEEKVLEQRGEPDNDQNYNCCDIEVLRMDDKGDTATVYAMVLEGEYSFNNGELNMESGSHGPAVFTVNKTGDGYELTEYWVPRDGSYYVKDIRAKFPITLWAKTDTQLYIKEQESRCEDKVLEYIEDGTDGNFTMNFEKTKIYYYSGNVVEGHTWIEFSITLYPDGTFSYYETPISSFIGIGKYQIKDGILTLVNDKEMTGSNDVFRFRIEGDRLYYIAEGSANFMFVHLEDGEEFVEGVNPVAGWLEQYADQAALAEDFADDPAEEPAEWMDIELPDGYYFSDYTDAAGYTGGFAIISNKFYLPDYNPTEPEIESMMKEGYLAGIIGRVSSEDLGVEYDKDHAPEGYSVPIQFDPTEYLKTISCGDGWYIIMSLETHDPDVSSDYWCFWFVKEGEDVYYTLTLSEKDFSQEEAEQIAGNVKIVTPEEK